ncbi:uncharacterized protein N7496_012445 [Penicillium cataractarum]|uniref:Uncharacterized protein n=1 Tax=Penicillium cataractarum TaxID=2100454 RepID=A0A9W9R806_9EURO|nr:uncharacterized protein N7496_012445 [Penicillium cataractarum]KAJ5355233.1 hypothetical protein N7496_012445 [Penicillium cataractarum]
MHDSLNGFQTIKDSNTTSRCDCHSLGKPLLEFSGLQAMLDYHSSHQTAEDTIARFVSTRDNYGLLPLHWAAVGPQYSFEHKLPDYVVSERITNTLILLLASAPETINIPDAEGVTPFLYAVKSSALYGESTHAVAKFPIRFLLEHGADASVSDNPGRTVLHWVFDSYPRKKSTNNALLELLVSHGAPINHLDKEGNTPLHIIANSHYMAKNPNQVQTIKFLIHHGADIKAENLDGDTVFHVAATGELRPHYTSDGKVKRITIEEKIRVQDELMTILQEAAGTDDMMHQANHAGATPRQLCAETRNK